MPMVLRSVITDSDAVLGFAGRGSVRLPEEILMATTVSRLAESIHHLGQVAKYAAEMFDEFLATTSNMLERTTALSDRVERIEGSLPAIKAECESTLKEFSFAVERSDWRSRAPPDHGQLFMQPDRTTTTNRLYYSISANPPLHQLDHFRDDGVPCMKLYSYPQFFQEEWIRLRQKEDEERRKRKKKTVQHNVSVSDRAKGARLKDVKVKQYDHQGNLVSIQEDTPSKSQSAPPSKPVTALLGAPPPPPPGGGIAAKLGAPPPPPPGGGVAAKLGAPPPPPPGGARPAVDDGLDRKPSAPTAAHMEHIAGGPVPNSVAALGAILAGALAPPVAPPSASADDMDLGLVSKAGQLNMSSHDDDDDGPPPPPPSDEYTGVLEGMTVPPPPPIDSAPPPPPVFIPAFSTRPKSSMNMGAGLRVVDPRDNLLNQIQSGYKLKTVQTPTPSDKKAGFKGGSEIASILARRMAMEFSDSESESEEENDDWDD